jgi:hypothetical protein
MQSTNTHFGGFAAVTPSDTTLINCNAIYIGGAGNIAISYSNTATAVTFIAPPVGTVLPIFLNGGRIMQTNTTATNIVALQ